MSGNSTTVTELTSQYSAQVTADLERNRKEQDRIAGEIEALQAQLTALRHDRTVLENVQRALGAAQEPVGADDASVPAAEEEEPVAVVPAPRAQEPRTTRRTKAAGAGKRAKETRPAKRAKGKGTGAGTASRRRTGARNTSTDDGKGTDRTTAKAVDAAAASSASSPSLVELVRGHLAERQEPRSAAEVASALAEQYPERGVKATVVRSTLEGLVARNQAHRSKQGRSVFYTVPDASEPSAPSAPAERSPEEESD
ncbi:hypothetical protein [Streptomyces sp. NPDC046859]|uniref:hypothetical protein n=1 Tax=Streptomyces sp. NPDC046859 TaxID=3155734 RepID=UPI003406EB5C